MKSRKEIEQLAIKEHNLDKCAKVFTDLSEPQQRFLRVWVNGYETCQKEMAHALSLIPEPASKFRK